MEAYIYLYHWYTSVFGKLLRLAAFVFIVVFVAVSLSNGILPKQGLAFLILFLMLEIFFHFKIGKIMPSAPGSFTRQALSVFLLHGKTPDVIKALIKHPQAHFTLERATISKDELPLSDIPKKQLQDYAAKVAQSVNGMYVTTMDCIVGYLLLAESETKLLFNKQIKPQELMDVLIWARSVNPEEEQPKKTRVMFTEEGFGEVLVTGWTYETRKYTHDITSEALSQRPLRGGRINEYKQVVETLLKKDKNNVLLIGEHGSGRTALVRALAYESFMGQLSGINHYRILELMIGPLIAGTANRAELEVRLQSILAELSHSGNTIIFIPELQDITGSSAFNVDLSGALLPYLQGGAIPVIGSVTPGAYKTFIEHNPIKDVFAPIRIEAPDRFVAIRMLFSKAQDIEYTYGVIFSYRAIVAAVDLANRYMQDAILPGAAVTLLEDTANSLSLSAAAPFYEKTRKKLVLEANVQETVEQKTKVSVAAPKGEEKELLLHFEDKLHERVIDQVEAITLVSEAMRRSRAGLTTAVKPISFLFLGPTGVGKTETAKALATLYFGGEDKMLRFDMSEYADTEGIKRLLGAAPGEGEGRGEMTDKIHDHPFSLVLLDEFEKAHPTILDLFLQVLEDGRLTDNKGKTVSFANAIVIATSNAGSEFIREELQKGRIIDKQFQQDLLNTLQTKAVFKPELLNRFDEVVTFKPLEAAEAIEITKLLLKSVVKKIQEQDITLTFDQAVIQKIATDGCDTQFGARPLRRYIQNNIEDLLAKKLLSEEIHRGSTVTLGVDAQNAIETIVHG